MSIWGAQNFLLFVVLGKLLRIFTISHIKLYSDPRVKFLSGLSLYNSLLYYKYWSIYCMEMYFYCKSCSSFGFLFILIIRKPRAMWIFQLFLIIVIIIAVVYVVLPTRHCYLLYTLYSNLSLYQPWFIIPILQISKLRSEKLSNLSKVTQLKSGRTCTFNHSALLPPRIIFILLHTGITILQYICSTHINQYGMCYLTVSQRGRHVVW